MKDQYVGDINHFEKYAILRVLQRASGTPLIAARRPLRDDPAGERFEDDLDGGRRVNGAGQGRVGIDRSS